MCFVIFKTKNFVAHVLTQSVENSDSRIFSMPFWLDPRLSRTHRV
jgi:hypothetical protein